MIGYKKLATLSGVLCIGVFPLDAMADITLRETAQAIINYDAYARAQENNAIAIDMYAPAPQIETTLEAAQNVTTANTQIATAIQSDLGGLLPWYLTSAYGVNTFLPVLSQQQMNTYVAGAPEIVATHFSLFCSSMEANIYGNTYCASKSALPDGDLNPLSLFGSTVLDPSSNNGIGVVAAREFVKKLTAPSYSQLLPSATGTPPQMASFSDSALVDLTRRMTSSAQTSLASYSLLNMLEARMPQSALTGASGNPANPNMSLMQMMEQEATRRFNDPSWAEALASTPQAAVLRELAHMEAFKMYMQFMQYQQFERIEALLATMVNQNTYLIRKPTNDQNLAISTKAVSNQQLTSQQMQQKQNAAAVPWPGY